MSSRVPLTVAVPTIGRPELLRRLLESLVRNTQTPEEILVIDQSGTTATEEVAGEFAPTLGVRVVPDEGKGVARARNRALREASCDLVLFTDDDCTVASDWVDRGWAHLRSDSSAIVTGRVLSSGDETPIWVRDEPNAHDYTGERRCSVLYSANMGFDRGLVLEIGGFDERLVAAEDNDLCYRWLRAGRRLVYRPDVVVWHHAWRDGTQLDSLYQRYARAQGAFYAKHLRRGDLTMLRFIAKDYAVAIGASAAAAIRGKPPLTPWRRGVFRGLPAGLRAGWRAYGSETYDTVS
jgi:GT2 family glycosyltransferase